MPKNVVFFDSRITGYQLCVSHVNVAEGTIVAAIVKPLVHAITSFWIVVSLLITPALADTVTATLTVGTSPERIAVNPQTNKIYVLNKGSNEITVIDGATNTTSTVPVAALGTAYGGGNRLAINAATNKIYVVHNANRFGNNIVTVIDGATNTTTTVGVGSDPSSVVVNPVTNKIYVLEGYDNSYSVIDGATNTVTKIPTQWSAESAAVNTSTNTIYMRNLGANSSGAITSISVVNGADNTVISIVPTGARPVTPVVNEVTNKIYVPNLGISTVSKSTVTVVDGATNTASTVTAGISPIAAVVNPLTNKIYVANLNDDTVTVIDGQTNATSSVSAGQTPRNLAVNTVTNQIYVVNQDNNSITVIDGATNTTSTLQSGWTPVDVAVNPVTNKIYVVNSGTNNVTVISGTVHANQTISFGPAPTVTVAGVGTVSATASSGLAIYFVSTTPSICTVSGSTVTGIAAGTCIITANQDGNASYAAAPTVMQNITVSPAVVPFVSLSPTTLTFTVQTVGTTSAAKTVTLTNTGGAVLNIASIVANGDFARTTTCGVTLAAAANCTIDVTFTPSVAGASLSSLVITSNAASSPNTVSLSGTGTTTLPAPVCSLTANPASIFAGGSSKLTAICSPLATSYVWTGGTCPSQSTDSCTVTPAANTSYTVKGVNVAGSGSAVSATVAVVTAPAIYSGGLYEGIYQWAPGYYLTVQQHGTTIIAANYFTADGNYSFTSPDGHVLLVPQLDLFDLYHGSITGANATITGTEFHRVCNVGYDFAFSDSGNITVTKTTVSNTAAATQAGISCSAITMPIGTVLSVPKILF